MHQSFLRWYETEKTKQIDYERNDEYANHADIYRHLWIVLINHNEK